MVPVSHAERTPGGRKNKARTMRDRAKADMVILLGSRPNRSQAPAMKRPIDLGARARARLRPANQGPRPYADERHGLPTNSFGSGLQKKTIAMRPCVDGLRFSERHTTGRLPVGAWAVLLFEFSRRSGRARRYRARDAQRRRTRRGRSFEPTRSARGLRRVCAAAQPHFRSMRRIGAGPCARDGLAVSVMATTGTTALM